MKRETILKTILVLIIGVMLFARPVNVFATDDIGNFFNPEYEDQGSLKDIETGTNTDTNTNNDTNKDANTDKETNKDTNTKPNNKLPEAGLAEDTAMVVTLVVLGVAAIFTFKKANEYKNI